MRVLHVINRFSTAGAETSLRELIQASADHIEHGVVVLHADRNDFSALQERNVPNFVPREPTGGQRSHVRHVWNALQHFHPDLVHTSLFEASTAGRLAARAARTPVLTSLVNTPFVPAALADTAIPLWKHRTVRLVDHALSRFATTHFHAITQAVADHYVDVFSLSRNDISVIPRGRSRHRLGLPSGGRRAAVRAALGLKAEERLLLAVGRQEPQKGQRHLIEAAPAIVAAHSDVRIMLAGREGTATPELRERVTRLGAMVEFLGFRSDVPDLLCAADVFVFPSLYEGLGGAVLEAMAMDLPIVASAVPAIAEVLDDGACGLLVPPADADSLADACIRLLDDVELSQGLASRARARFDSVYSAEAATRGMVSLYERLIA